MALAAMLGLPVACSGDEVEPTRAPDAGHRFVEHGDEAPETEPSRERAEKAEVEAPAPTREAAEVRDEPSEEAEADRTAARPEEASEPAPPADLH